MTPIEIGDIVKIPPDGARRRVVRIREGQFWCVLESRGHVRRASGPFTREELLVIEIGDEESRIAWDWQGKG